jgi:hypothetical protein
VGLLTAALYQNNIQPILNNEKSINLGSAYESAVAQELSAHNHKLFYYDNRAKGEVDFLINDPATASILPIEVKSGKDYTRHSALDNLLSVQDYYIKSGVVLSNEREVKIQNNITYMPVYYSMFIGSIQLKEEELLF